MIWLKGWSFTLLLLLFWLLLVIPSHMFGQDTKYLVSETELQSMIEITRSLQTRNSCLSTELSNFQMQYSNYQLEIDSLKLKSEQLINTQKQTQSNLVNLQISFTEYKTEAQQTINNLELQRNVGFGVGIVGILIGLIGLLF